MMNPELKMCDYGASAVGCFCVAVGKDASATGFPIVGHNEDDGLGVRLKTSHGLVPPIVWPEGYKLPAEKGFLDETLEELIKVELDENTPVRIGMAPIPQVPGKTYGYFWSEARNSFFGYSTTDGYLNENGVHLVSDNMCESKEDRPKLKEGGIQQNLRRAVAERATSARHAVEIIKDLVEEWGYVPSGRGYAVSDNREVWIVQVVSGVHCIAVRVPDDHVVIMPNHFTIHHLDDYPDVVYSDDLVDYAVERGWYKPKTSGDYSDFDFAAAYQAEEHTNIPYNTFRQGYGYRHLGFDFGVGKDNACPFSVQVPKGSVTLAKVREILSSHYDGTEDDYERIGPGNNPHDTNNLPNDEGVRRICTGYTSESAICQHTAIKRNTTMWIAFGHPCSMPHVPFHPLCGKLPDLIGDIRDPIWLLANKFESAPVMTTYDERSGVQKLRDFQCLLDMVFDQHYDEVRDKLNLYMTEKNAKNFLLVESASDEELFAFDEAAIKEAVELVNKYAHEKMTLVEMETAAIDRLSPPEAIHIQFRFSEEYEPVEETMCFGMGLLDTKYKYYPPIKDSLKKVNGEENCWTVSFPGPPLAIEAKCAGVFEHFIGGRTTTGRAFTGMIKIMFIS